MMKRLLFLAAFFSILISHSVSAQILAEAFRSIGCVNCVGIDAQYQAFIESNPSLKVQIVYFHNNISTIDDPFYAISKADVDARMNANFYQVITDPILFVSGFNAGAGAAQIDNWKSLTSNPAAAAYTGTLSASALIDPNGKVIVTLHAGGTSGGKQVRPYAMLVESGIKFANDEGYGNPPDSIWNDMFRATIPGSQGGDPFVLSGAKDIVLTYDPTGKPWVLSNCKIVAFLQEVNPQASSNNHRIDALAITSITTASVSESNSTSAASIGAPIPNPSSSTTQIPFHIVTPANVKIIVCDDLGREVETIYNGFAEGSSFATFTPKNLSRGIYYARMYAGGNYIGMQKIIFAP